MKEKYNIIFDNLKNIAKALAITFGSNCEVVVHDTSHLENSVLMIENGHITGRKIGSPMTDLGLHFLQSDLFKHTDFVANYQTKSKFGSHLKSTTIFIKNEKKEVIGHLCINVCLDDLLKFKRKIDNFCSIDKQSSKIDSFFEGKETFANTIDEILEKIFYKAQQTLGESLNNTNKDEKIKIIRYLKENGVFLIKGNIEKVARKLNVTNSTVYHYLSKVSNNENIKKI